MSPVDKPRTHLRSELFLLVRLTDAWLQQSASYHWPWEGSRVAQTDSTTKRDAQTLTIATTDFSIWEDSMSRSRRQILISSYHKTGTTLIAHVMEKVAVRLGLSIATKYGMAWGLDITSDIILLPHSLLGFALNRPFRSIRLVRDPRDIWVSGYLYHKRCTEGWCINTDFDLTSPILYPRVDFSFQHRPERWKRRYLQRLNGKSYQRNLVEKDQSSGLEFELQGYTGSTLEAMQAWRSQSVSNMDVRLEELQRDYDTGMWAILRHLGLSDDECSLAVEIARSEDIMRMDDATIAKMPHVFSRTSSKWGEYLSPDQVRQFERQYGHRQS